MSEPTRNYYPPLSAVSLLFALIFGLMTIHDYGKEKKLRREIGEAIGEENFKKAIKAYEKTEF